ncbi:MAG TPA: YlmC/YmxH family sporulation protein [Bacillota bacterium]|nr:YlmC/YmxH family sporulation protein [Bacillota bacterium]
MKPEKPMRPFLTFGEFRDKEVINLADGKRMGYVCDIEFDAECGRILRLLLPPPGKYYPFFMPKEFIYIPWSNIEKIGTDIILVRWADTVCPT